MCRKSRSFGAGWGARTPPGEPRHRAIAALPRTSEHIHTTRLQVEFPRALLFVAGLGAYQADARGDAIGTLRGTGEGLPTGVIDPHFTITSAPTGATLKTGGAVATVPAVADAPYVAVEAGDQWIGPDFHNRTEQPVGDYNFRTTFDLAGLDPATARIAGSIAADNRLVDISLNGTSLGIGGAMMSSLLDFSISQGFVPGVNTLDFLINNDATGGPAALMVSQAGTASPVPEPATIGFFALIAGLLAERQARPSRVRRA